MLYPNNGVQGLKTILLIIHSVHKKEWLALKFWDKVILAKMPIWFKSFIQANMGPGTPHQTTQELKVLWWMREQDLIGALINVFWLGNPPRFINRKCPCLNKITKLWYKNNDKCLVIGCYTSPGIGKTSTILVCRIVFKMLSNRQATAMSGWPFYLFHMVLSQNR